MPPTPTLICTHFQEAEHSMLKPYGFSNFDRYERELQRVSLSAENKKVAFDWTFQTDQKLQITRRQHHLHWKQGFHQGDYHFGHRSHHSSKSNISPITAHKAKRSAKSSSL
jgi:hypothetical protein